MTGPAVLRVKKLSGLNVARVAAKHNLREIAAELDGAGAIQPDRIWQNTLLYGANNSAAVAAEARAIRVGAGVARRRSNCVDLVEVLVSIPRSATVDERAFFRDALDWVQRQMNCPVISAVVHRDEGGGPHMHVLLVPLLDGRMQGAKVAGGPSDLARLQIALHQKVAAGYGFPAPRTKAAQKLLAQRVIDRLLADRDPLTMSPQWHLVEGEIRKAPGRWASEIGLEDASSNPPGDSAFDHADSDVSHSTPVSNEIAGGQGESWIARLGMPPLKTWRASARNRSSVYTLPSPRHCQSVRCLGSSSGQVIDPETGEIIVWSKPQLAPGVQVAVDVVAQSASAQRTSGVPTAGREDATGQLNRLPPQWSAMAVERVGFAWLSSSTPMTQLEVRRRAEGVIRSLRKERAGPGWRPPNLAAVPNQHLDAKTANGSRPNLTMREL